MEEGSCGAVTSPVPLPFNAKLHTLLSHLSLSVKYFYCSTPPYLRCFYRERNPKREEVVVCVRSGLWKEETLCVFLERERERELYERTLAFCYMYEKVEGVLFCVLYGVKP